MSTSDIEVAVVHKTFGNGGAEMTCIHILKALQQEYNLTLVTDRSIDTSNIKAHFGIELSDDLKVINYMSKSVLNRIQRTTGLGFHRLQTTYLERFLRGTNFDYYISTKNEVTCPGPSIQYIHFPYVISKEMLEVSGEITYDWKTGRLPIQLYKQLWAKLFFDTDFLQSDDVSVLVNSARTRHLINTAYGCDASVLSPPVPDTFNALSWRQQESGAVAIPGRIIPQKRVERIIEIADHVTDENFHVHMIGAVPDTPYARDIVSKVEDRDDIIIEGEVDRTTLEDMLESHRYGLQVRDENFGIAVAEMVLARSLPFVVQCDPLRTLVANRRELIFEDSVEAARLIDRVMDDADLQKSLRKELSELDKPYRASNFRSNVRRIVSDAL